MIEDRTYKIVREVDDTKFRRANPQEQWFMTHAWPRVELLLTKLWSLGSYGDGFIAGVPAEPLQLEGSRPRRAPASSRSIGTG